MDAEIGPDVSPASDPQVPLLTIARVWGRIGCVGFGGPPAHIALLRRQCVTEHHWLTEHDFENGIAATNLLPGPASTQLAIWCAWRLRGRSGAAVGGICFIAPGLILILGLAAVFLAASPPTWVLGAAAGAGAAVPAVALNAAFGLTASSWRRGGSSAAAHVRWVAYAAAGATAAATAGPWIVVVLAACGVIELAVRTGGRPHHGVSASAVLPLGVAGAGAGLGALAWVAFKVGALSYGGGFVIVPLMQHDAVNHYHWMTGAQFLNAVALGQITPGPVVQTVAVVGYAAAGIGGGLLAALIAFTPSFGFILAGGDRFDRLRSNPGPQAFLAGAGPAAIGAIAGASIPLASALAEGWQFGVLAGAAAWLLVLRWNVPVALVTAGVIGIVAALLGAPLAH